MLTAQGGLKARSPAKGFTQQGGSNTLGRTAAKKTAPSNRANGQARGLTETRAVSRAPF
jgi:hypothetical protein